MGTQYENNAITGDVITPKIRITPEGGLAVLLINNSGSPIVKGTVVVSDPGNAGSVIPAPIDSVFPIGIVYQDIANRAYGWIVIAGRCEVLVDPATAPSQGWWLGVSATTAGYARSQNTDPGATILHSREVGHTLGPKHSGNLLWAIVHWN